MKKNKKEKISHIIDTVTAVNEVFISEAQKVAMAVEGDEVDRLDTKLTKGDRFAPVIDFVSTNGLFYGVKG